MSDQTSHRNHLGQPIGFSIADWKAPAWPPRESIDGRYCRLEPLEVGHTQQLWDANAFDRENRNWTYLTHGPYASIDEYRDWVERASSTSDQQFFAIVSGLPKASAVPKVPGGVATGVAAYLRIAPEFGTIEVGHINFSPLVQRTPAATEAMYLMMKRAFGLGYRRYEWKCDALNAASRRAAQRLGLSYEGIFRQATVYKGRNRDTAWYAAIDRDWPALGEAFERWLDPANFDDKGAQRVRLSDLTAPILVARG